MFTRMPIDIVIYGFARNDQDHDVLSFAAEFIRSVAIRTGLRLTKGLHEVYISNDFGL